MGDRMAERRGGKTKQAKRVVAPEGTAASALETQLNALDLITTSISIANGGRGVAVVFDGVGAASWAASLAATARRGLIVTYGNASGPVPPFSPLELNRAGSLYVTRPKLYDYIHEPGALQSAAATLFDMIADGKLRIDIGRRFPLVDAAEAHRALEGRQTTGSAILLP